MRLPTREKDMEKDLLVYFSLFKIIFAHCAAKFMFF